MWSELIRLIEEIDFNEHHHLISDEMPCESVKCSIDDIGQIRAERFWTYSSQLKIDNHKYLSGTYFEQKQTWIASQSVSNHRKRYQSSIENIHLTIPSISTTRRSTITNADFYTQKKTKMDRSISQAPTTKLSSIYAQPKKISNHIKSSAKHPKFLSNSMRIFYSNGDFMIRI